MRFFDWLLGRSSVDLSGDCKHVWSNWSDPYEGITQRHHIFNTEIKVVEADAWFQKRSCLQCNRMEVRVL